MRRDVKRVAMVCGVLALAGCAASPDVSRPFQAMATPNELGFGYREFKVDASHYTVVYVGDHPESAQAYLELRAAQIARDTGFAYFTFSRRGVEVLRRHDYDLVMRERIPVARNGALNPNDLIPDTHEATITVFYYAWGEMALLPPDQGRANAQAFDAGAVLAKAAAAR
jgi:hypothetical protein